MSDQVGYQNVGFLMTRLVFALKYDNFPECAAEWLTRRRDFNWPTAEMIDKCMELGCLFLAAGLPASDEQHQLWRMSL